MLPGSDADRGRHDLRRHRAQAIEIGLDPAGRECDREVTVEPGVRRPQRPGEAVVCTLGQEVARGLVADRIGDNDDERGVGPELGAPLTVGAPLLERRVGRKRWGVGRGPRAGDHRSVGTDHVSDRVDDRKRDHAGVIDARLNAKIVGKPDPASRPKA